MEEAVRTAGLVKVYEGKETIEALKSVDLSINRGELFTLLGPNGAGKTTFLRIISTQLMPTKGEVRVLGHDVVTEADEVRKHIAVVPQDVMAYANFTPWEYSYYFSRLRGMSKHETEAASAKALKAVGLWDLRDRVCGSLSGGEKKRAIIALALASNADVLMLDEPTSGLDAVARRDVWAVLRELVEQGKTILLTTHIMEEAEILSDRLVIINKGQIVANGTLEEIKSLTKDKFRVIMENNSHEPNQLQNTNHSIRLGNKQIVYVKNESEALELVGAALKKGVKAEAAMVTLEDVFVKLVGRSEEN